MVDFVALLGRAPSDFVTILGLLKPPFVARLETVTERAQPDCWTEEMFALIRSMAEHGGAVTQWRKFRELLEPKA